MFSRPIVTEGQAPALILANWHEPEETQLHELLEWSPAVVGHSEQAYELATRQTNIDVAIGHAGLAEISNNTLADDGVLTMSFPDEYLVIGKGFETH